jgi:hypothetical protein
MCIAILCPKGTEITAQQFRNSWDNNYNGAGLMYNDDNNKLHVVKEMEDCDKLYKKYVSLVKKHPNATFVLHFRISNRGVINRANCHPFKVNSELGFVHNGTILSVDKDDKMSDTNIFNRSILRKLPHVDVNFLSNGAVQSILGDFIGRSKIVFLDNAGDYAILNEEDGYWEEGIWYSNDSHDKVSDYVDMGGERVHRSRINTDGTLKEYSSNNHAGYGSQRSIGYQWGWEDDYNWNGGRGRISDLHSSSEASNASVGNSYPKDPVDIYKIADGTEKCPCCQAHIGEDELLNSSGECMECLSEVEAADVAAAAVEDGFMLKGWADGSVKVEGGETVECDACREATPTNNIAYIGEWSCSLCPSCKKDLIEQELIEDDSDGDLNSNCYSEA